MKNNYIRSAFALFGIGLLSILAACEKDNGGDNNNNNNNTPAPAAKAFFNLDGQVFVGETSPSFEVRRNSDDTQVFWSSKGRIVDTTISVYHVVPHFRAAKYTVDSMVGFTPGTVEIWAEWGTESTSPKILVTSGTYELKRENNKFVGYLTNGKGKNTKNGRRYNSITMKFIYPF